MRDGRGCACGVHDPKTAAMPPREAAFGYVIIRAGVLQPYLDLVAAYGWANYMFQTNQGPSYPAHQFLFGATSAPSAQDDHSGIFVAENAGNGWRSDVRRANTVLADRSAGQGKSRAWFAPCFEHLTIADHLDARARLVALLRQHRRQLGGYREGTASGSRPNSIKHICVPIVNGKCTGTEWTSNLIVHPVAVLSDISTNCNLRRRLLGDAGQLSTRTTLAGQQTPSGPSWVALDRQRGRKQPMQEPRRQLVLEQHRHHHHLGRLGRLVRS